MYIQECSYESPRAEVGEQSCIAYSKSFAAEVGIDQSSSVGMSMRNGKLIVAPADKPKYSLKKLLAQVNEDNLHYEVETGPAV